MFNRPAGVRGFLRRAVSPNPVVEDWQISYLQHHKLTEFSHHGCSSCNMATNSRLSTRISSRVHVKVPMLEEYMRCAEWSRVYYARSSKQQAKSAVGMRIQKHEYGVDGKVADELHIPLATWAVLLTRASPASCISCCRVAAIVASLNVVVLRHTQHYLPYELVNFT